jgi:sugar phosphate isomerase/epimerase
MSSIDERVAVSTGAFSERELDPVLRAIAACGATSVELAMGAGNVQQLIPDIAPILVALERYKLRLVGVAASTDFPVGSAELHGLIGTAKRLGAGFVRVFAPPFARDIAFEHQIEHLRGALRELMADAEGSAVDVLVELAQNTLIPSPELARYVISPLRSVSVGVVYDPANMLVEGHLRVEYAVACLGVLLRHVHVKNQVITANQLGVQREFVAVDAGAVDWSRTLEVLAMAGYGGRFTIDHFAGGDEVSVLQRDVASLAQMLGELRAGRQSRIGSTVSRTDRR